MKKLLKMTAIAALYTTTALAQDFPPAVQDAIQQLAREGFREVKVQRGPFGTRVKAEGNGIEREILIQFGEVVRDKTESDSNDDGMGVSDDDDSHDDDSYDDSYDDSDDDHDDSYDDDSHDDDHGRDHDDRDDRGSDDNDHGGGDDHDDGDDD